MTAGLPWSDERSDPIADMLELARAIRDAPPRPPCEHAVPRKYLDWQLATSLDQRPMRLVNCPMCGADLLITPGKEDE